MNGTEPVVISISIDIYFISAKLEKVVGDRVYQQDIMKTCVSQQTRFLNVFVRSKMRIMIASTWHFHHFLRCVADIIKYRHVCHPLSVFLKVWNQIDID